MYIHIHACKYTHTVSRMLAVFFTEKLLGKVDPPKRGRDVTGFSVVCMRTSRDLETVSLEELAASMKVCIYIQIFN